MRIESPEGKVGWGEAAPLPGFSKESLSDVIEELTQGALPTFPSSKWGMAAALLDLIDPLDIESIPIRKLGEDKVKLGNLTLEEALQVMEKRKARGVDMNQQWSLQDALAFAEHFPELDYFEEPLKKGEDQSAFPWPVALDESLRGGKSAYPNVTMLVIKPTLLGYPLPKLREGTRYILSSSYESELGLHQIAKLAIRLKLPLFPMGLGTSHLFQDELYHERLVAKEGHLYFPKKWTLKEEKVEIIHDGFF